MNSPLFTLPLSRRCPCWQMAPAQKNPGAWYRLSPTQCCRETQSREPSSGHLAKAGQVQLLYALRFLRVCPFYPPFAPLLPLQAFTRSISCDKHLAVAYFQRGTVFYQRQK